MIGNRYISSAITVRHRNGKWGGELAYIDSGFLNDDSGRVSTEGELRTRYLIADGEDLDALTVVLDVLLADAAKLGIEMHDPALFIDEGDHSEVPENWGALAYAQCERLGWTPLPSQVPAQVEGMKTGG